MNNRGAGNAEPSKKRNRRSLKAESKIKKGPPASVSLKVDKAKDHQPVWRNRRRKRKGVSKGKRENNTNEIKNDKNQSSRDDKLLKNGAKAEHAGEGQDAQRNQERCAGSSKSQPNQKNKEKHAGWDKTSGDRSKEKLDVKINNQWDEKKKEKLGGLIFMCNAKTKPDCLRYQVMGVTQNKRDLVLGVKPGLKLFLYDFDLKLMYGIYQAASSGGMKLEPKAFGGSFPVQVRFIVHKDCIPLPEGIFKKAIKENYDANNKFDIELTALQVRKLSALFQPVAFHPVMQPVKLAAVPVHSAPVTAIQDREASERLRERTLPERERFLRVNDDGKRYLVLSYQRDHQGIEQQEVVPTKREEAPRDLYMSEKEYRTYGLRRERLNQRDHQGIQHQEVVPTNRDETPRHLYMSEKEYRTYGLQREIANFTPPHSHTSTLDPYPRTLEREHLLRKSVHTNSDEVPGYRESLLPNPPYSMPRDYLMNSTSRSELLPAAPSVSAVPSSSAVSGLDSYSRRNPYYSYQYGALSTNAYLLPSKREEVTSSLDYIDSKRENYLAKSDPLRREETDTMDRLYMKYGVEPLSDYKQAYQRSMPETVPPLVSSRYSFAGPSMLYR